MNTEKNSLDHCCGEPVPGTGGQQFWTIWSPSREQKLFDGGWKPKIRFPFHRHGLWGKRVNFLQEKRELSTLKRQNGRIEISENS